MKVKMITAINPPVKKRTGDAAFDVFSPVSLQLPPKQHIRIKLGLAIEIAEDEVCLVQERSGMASNNGIMTIGNVIDSNYRGEISATLFNGGSNHYGITQGERIAQLVILKLGNQELEIVEELSENLDRGDAGFGSSGK